MYFTTLKFKEKLNRAKATTKFDSNLLDFLKTLITPLPALITLCLKVHKLEIY